MDQSLNINFRIISIDEKEHSMVVRYWTDDIPELSEDALATEFEYNEKGESVIKRTSDGHPTRCRTDSNMTIYKDGATRDEIIDQIKKFPPVEWFKLKLRKPSEHIKSLHKHKGSFKHSKPEENKSPRDLTEKEIDDIISASMFKK